MGAAIIAFWMSGEWDEPDIEGLAFGAALPAYMAQGEAVAAYIAEGQAIAAYIAEGEVNE